MKIAVVLDENRNIFDVNNTSEAAAVEQSKKEGWILVEDDPAFLVSERYMWTVRQSDNALVHISTGMTPDEEKLQATALLGKQVGEANVNAKAAQDLANGAIQSAAQLGKMIAPLLASTTTEDGGTK